MQNLKCQPAPPVQRHAGQLHPLPEVSTEEEGSQPWDGGGLLAAFKYRILCRKETSRVLTAGILANKGALETFALYNLFKKTEEDLPI